MFKSALVLFLFDNFDDSGFDKDIAYKTFSCTPCPPNLAYIVPQTSTTGIIDLDWNEVDTAFIYHVFSSSSYIWSVDGLDALIAVSESNYTDNRINNGIYYYVIVAENRIGNSTISNCEFVEVTSPEPSLLAPVLSFIVPNPSDISNIFLNWDDVDGATEYYIYRSNAYFWSVDSMTPLTTVVDSDYIDSLPSEDYYFYVIVATDGVTNSTLSNCEYVEYKLPTLFEYLFPIGLTISLACIVTFAIVLKRRKVS